MIGNHAPRIDQDKLAKYFAAVVAAITPAVAQAMEMTTGAHQAEAGEKAMMQTGTAQNLAKEERKDDVQPDLPWSERDRFSHYEEEVLEDGRKVKRYEDGTVRIENPKSGVIHEERKDGKLLVSLPGSRLLFQDFPGDPLLAYDLSDLRRPPALAQVGYATTPGRTEPGLVYTFSDPDEGSHVVDVDSLRYYRTRQG